MSPRRQAPGFCTWWILFCAYCSVAGWVLSLAHALNPAGYVVVLFVGVIAGWVACRRLGAPCFARPSLGPLRRRCRRALPAGFYILAALAFLGGALYAPNNWDALAYRVPRVLHWLAAGQWHWIHTIFGRLNVRGCGYEWMMAPLIALTKTDRLLFLPNFIAFCLLPGLFFAALTGVGVGRRAAWAWMWVLPTGYCYLVQAGGIGNDLFGSFFALAAFAYAISARQNESTGQLWLSAIAMALSTGVKANNLLLVPVWAVVALPCWRRLLIRPLATVAVAVVALGVSFVPTAVLNTIYAHDWSGTKTDKMENVPGQHFERIVGNIGVVLVENASPPVAPFARTWNTRIAPKLLSHRYDEVFGCAPGSPVLQMDELQVEESAGLGLGVCALLLLSALLAIRPGSRITSTLRSATEDGHHAPRITRHPSLLPIFAATALALIAFFAVSFPTKSEARLLNAYYAFLVLPLLVGAGQEKVVRSAWWRAAAVTVMAAAVLPLVLSPARPLAPVQTVVAELGRRGHHSALLNRAEKVYSVYSRRAEALAPLAQLLPVDAKTIAFLGFDDLETSLWKPFGSRRVLHLCPADTPADLRAAGVTYICLSARQFQRLSSEPFEAWLERFNADVIARVPLALRGAEEATEWLVIRLK